MTTPKYKLHVTVDQDVCVSAGLCVLSSADVFDQREPDGVVTLRLTDIPESEWEKVLSAARKCPSRAIQVEKIPDPS
ncbi:MAG TPA: ferredoxin [Ramlibacter sp.]|nr:ferredoxin [Ramlibacter sp.]